MTGATAISYKDHSVDAFLRGGKVKTVIYAIKVRLSEILDEEAKTHIIHGKWPFIIMQNFMMEN